MNIDFEKELNKAQYEAVSYIDGASLVIAGAGSGKTRVLTYKIAYLLENDYYPSEILALTFTNKAAKEMKERIANMLGKERVRYLQMGTFHSVFLRILRVEANHIGFDSNFTIYDTSDSLSLIRNIIKEKGLDDKKYKPQSVLSRISNIKNYLITPSMYAADAEAMKADRMSNMQSLHSIYEEYARRCKQAMAMDFDDILLYTHKLLNENKEILEKYQERFRYILVDEYQDTNYAQHIIVKLFAGKHRNICVVGDDAQSIYSFRGANISNIINFQKTYNGAKVFKLEQNYRSTKNIVAAANSLIEKNSNQIRKQVYSENELGSRVSLHNSYNDIEEAIYVARKIQRLHQQERFSYSEMAILYRANSQSRLFEEEFRRQGIPYRIYGGLSFYQRKEIKDVVAYFRVIVNPNDEEALRRIINYPTRGIGETTIKKIATAAAGNKVSMWQIMNEPLKYNLQINKGTHTKLQGFCELINAFTEYNNEHDAVETAEIVIRNTGIINELISDLSPENISRKENVEELINGIADFCNSRKEEGEEDYRLVDFLSEVSLLTDADNEDEENTDRVTLMTIHASKGLEFKNVFVVGLEEELFPSSRSVESIKDIEEERRLFYVAITRAEKNCFLSLAQIRMKYGVTESTKPSRFIADINPMYLDSNITISYPKPKTEQRQSYSSSYTSRSMFGQTTKTYSVPKTTSFSTTKSDSVNQNDEGFASETYGIKSGDKVEHNRFGYGTVESVEGNEGDMRAVIDFEEHGKKTLLLRFAKLRVMQ